MGDWRRTTWATTGMIVFIGLLGDATATSHSTLATVLFFVFAFVGLAIFVVAMAHPSWLPGRKSAEREANDAKERRHKDQLELDHKRADAERFRDFLNPHFTEDAQNRALNRHSEALERFLDAQDKSGDDNPTP